MIGNVFVWGIVVGGIFVAYKKASNLVEELDRVDKEQTAESEATALKNIEVEIEEQKIEE